MRKNRVLVKSHFAVKYGNNSGGPHENYLHNVRHLYYVILAQ